MLYIRGLRARSDPGKSTTGCTQEVHVSMYAGHALPYTENIVCLVMQYAWWQGSSHGGMLLTEI